MVVLLRSFSCTLVGKLVQMTYRVSKRCLSLGHLLKIKSMMKNFIPAYMAEKEEDANQPLSAVEIMDQNQEVCLYYIECVRVCELIS